MDGGRKPGEAGETTTDDRRRGTAREKEGLDNGGQASGLLDVWVVEKATDRQRALVPFGTIDKHHAPRITSHAPPLALILQAKAVAALRASVACSPRGNGVIFLILLHGT